MMGNLNNLKDVDDEKKSRASSYRGVSKNGGKWQVLFMAHKKRFYIGSIETEEEAARIYDE